jgi:tRNA G18 (ribose-2'-O)-methylase SpoU
VLQLLDHALEIPQLGVIRSLNVHVTGAIAMYAYTASQRSKQRVIGQQ